MPSNFLVNNLFLMLAKTYTLVSIIKRIISLKLRNSNFSNLGLVGPLEIRNSKLKIEIGFLSKTLIYFCPKNNSLPAP